MPEFTGERVIPGLVDVDLFNEHVSRYKFAARLLREGAAVLDLGCGTGYGTGDLTAAASIVGADISAEAVNYARANYGREGVTFLEASCDALPLPDHQFDLITAFEVIEHLDNWRGLLAEARRLLRPGGQFVVSTPNKAYYAETRGATGPNPFHTHEFEYGEFETALCEYFPQVRIWTQNHAAAIVFAPANPVGAKLNMLPQTPLVRTKTTVTSGISRRTSVSVLAAPNRSTPSRWIRPEGQSTKCSPRRSPSITSVIACSAFCWDS